MLLKNERGATAVYAAVVLAVLLMFAALAVDVNYLYGVRNELHNAADAGALAGARVLFNEDDGSLQRQAAIDEANLIASANKTGTENVYVKEVQTGHWSFANKMFTASENTTQVEWQERSFDDLDADPDFINAVRVHTERGDTPSFFANILGFDKFFVSTEAVAYIGFAGTLLPLELNQPIAICEESITDPDGNYSCNMGRMLNSGGNVATHNTGGWTNFTQPCQTASASDMKALVCSDGNPDEVQFGEGLGSTGGVQDSTLSAMYECWVDKSEGKTRNWNMTLPVVECPGNNVSNCAKLVGAVNVDLIWIVDKEDYDEAPSEMTIYDQDGNIVEQWSSDLEDGFERWKLFVDAFELANVDGRPASDDDYEEMYQKKNIFFLPSCEEHEPTGRTGGENYGILAKYPKLVK
jgi:hypothetical protein